MKYKLIIALVSILLLFGCKTKTISKSETKSDSTASKVITNTVYITKDSIVYKPKVEIQYQVINPCDSNGKLKPINQTSKNGSAKSTIKGKGDTLLIDCDCDEQINRFRSEISSKDSTISSLKTHVSSSLNDRQTEVVKYKTPFWNRVLIIFLVILSGSLIIILIKK